MGEDEPIKMFRSEFCCFMIGRGTLGRQGGNTEASPRLQLSWREKVVQGHFIGSNLDRTRGECSLYRLKGGSVVPVVTQGPGVLLDWGVCPHLSGTAAAEFHVTKSEWVFCCD